MRRVAEARHHSREEIEGYIAEYREIADNVDLTDEEHMSLGPAILGLIAAKQMLYEQHQPGPPILGNLDAFRGH